MRSSTRTNEQPLKSVGRLEQEADMVIFVPCPEMHVLDLDHEESHGITEAIIAKNRFGSTGKVKLCLIQVANLTPLLGDPDA